MAIAPSPKATAGAEVGGQVDMSVALKNLRSFQDRLTEWKVEGGLPVVTFAVIAHTDKKGQALFGSVAQFADCDVLYQLERVEHANQATLECVGARDIEDPPAITFEMQKVPIITAKGNEQNLVVSKQVEAARPDTETGGKKPGKEQREAELDELMWVTALSLSRPPERLIQYSAWFELTKAKRDGKLGTTTFSDAVKRLIASGQVRKVGDYYQVVLDVDAADGDGTPEAGVTPTPAPTPTPTPDSSPLRGRSKSGTPRSTPGAPGVNSTGNGNGEKTVVQFPDKAQQAMDHLLNKKH
jgi:hypothetical protein